MNQKIRVGQLRVYKEDPAYKRVYITLAKCSQKHWIYLHLDSDTPKPGILWWQEDIIKLDKTVT